MNLTYETKRKLLGFTFLIPYLLGFLMFFAVPLGQTIYYSFQKIDIPDTGGMSFTFLGLDNYVNLFLSKFSTIDESHAMYRVLLDENTNMLINMPLITLLALFLALLANRQFKGRAIVRMIFFLPIILGLDVVTEMLTISTGSEVVQSGGLFAESIVARLLRQYLAIPLTYLNPILEFVENIFSVIARSGVQTLVFLAALQSISPSMYEVAKIEGATAYETFWKVTIPSIMHIVMFVIIYTIIDIFLTSQIATEVYNFGFGYGGKPGDIGIASALSVVYIINVLLVLGLTLLVFRKAVSGNGK